MSRTGRRSACSDRHTGRRTAFSGAFSGRLIEMLESPAHRVLTRGARLVLDRLEIELTHHGGTDNGLLSVSYDQFVDYGMDRASIGPAIRECVALGFLEVTRQGRAGNAEFRATNQFRLTYHPVKGDPPCHDGTLDWRRITSMEEAAKIAKDARDGGFGREYRPGRSGRNVWEKKQKPGTENSTISVRNSHTEKGGFQGGESTLKAIAENPTLSSISRAGEAGERESIHHALNELRSGGTCSQVEPRLGSVSNDNDAGRQSMAAA